MHNVIIDTAPASLKSLGNSLNSLRKFASTRKRSGHKDVLFPHIQQIWENGFFKKLWLPEEFSFLFATELYKILSDEQKLFLNHLTWVILYSRTRTGEAYSLTVNELIGDVVKEKAPEVTEMLYLESVEERDHIRCFNTVFHHFFHHYQVSEASSLKKGRKILQKKGVHLFLLKQFGVEVILMYYLSRGILNHIGKAWEPVLSNTAENPLKSISTLHTHEENKHMATSRLMSQCIRELAPPMSMNFLKEFCFNRIEDFFIRYQFSEASNDLIEIQMLSHYLNQSSLFSSLNKECWRFAIAEHFNMPLLKNVILESTRLLPPVLLLSRFANQDDDLDGFLVKRGDKLIFGAALSHRLSDAFPDPLCFYPDRWKDKDQANKNAYLVFGGGPRRCPGENFAMKTLSLFLASLIQNHFLDIPDQTKISYRGVVPLTPRHKIPFRKVELDSYAFLPKKFKGNMMHGLQGRVS